MEIANQSKDENDDEEDHDWNALPREWNHRDLHVVDDLAWDFLLHAAPAGAGSRDDWPGLFFAQTPRWICLAILLGLCVANGAFSHCPDPLG